MHTNVNEIKQEENEPAVKSVLNGIADKNPIQSLKPETILVRTLKPDNKPVQDVKTVQNVKADNEPVHAPASATLPIPETKIESNKKTQDIDFAALTALIRNEG